MLSFYIILKLHYRSNKKKLRNRTGNKWIIIIRKILWEIQSVVAVKPNVVWGEAERKNHPEKLLHTREIERENETKRQSAQMYHASSL